MDNILLSLSERVADMAHIADETLGADYEPEPDDVQYEMRPIKGRFSLSKSTAPSESHGPRHRTGNASKSSSSSGAGRGERKGLRDEEISQTDYRRNKGVKGSVRATAEMQPSSGSSDERTGVNEDFHTTDQAFSDDVDFFQQPLSFVEEVTYEEGPEDDDLPPVDEITRETGESLALHDDEGIAGDSAVVGFATVTRITADPFLGFRIG